MILRFGISEHQTYLIVRAMVIALMIADERVAKRVASEVDRAHVKARTRHTDDEQPRTVVLNLLDIVVAEQTEVDNILVMQVVPETFLIRENLVMRQLVGYCLAVLLLHAQHDYAAIGIGERGITLPQTLRNTAFG